MNDLVWFGSVLLHIIPCRLFNAKSSVSLYIRYIYDLVSFVDYLMPNPAYSFN